MLHAIIMAGGSGTRFWPKSRRNRPKQLLTLSGDLSLIQQTYNRVLPLVNPDQIRVVTGADQGGRLCRHHLHAKRGLNGRLPQQSDLDLERKQLRHLG